MNKLYFTKMEIIYDSTQYLYMHTHSHIHIGETHVDKRSVWKIHLSINDIKMGSILVKCQYIVAVCRTKLN